MRALGPQNHTLINQSITEKQIRHESLQPNKLAEATFSLILTVTVLSLMNSYQLSIEFTLDYICAAL